MMNEKTVFTKVKFIPKYPILEAGNFWIFTPCLLSSQSYEYDMRRKSGIMAG